MEDGDLMHNSEKEQEYIYIPDENGKEEKFEVLYQFDHEDKHYILLVPADSDNDEDEAEVFAFRYEENDDTINLYMIEDEQEWDIVEEVFNTLNHEFYQ